MKQIKKMTLALLMTSLFFSSCNMKKKNTSSEFDDSPNIELVTLDNGEEVILRKDYYGTYSFNDWNSYNVVNTELHRAEELDFKTSLNRLSNLNEEILGLSNTIPNWLKTEEVMEDVDDVIEEYSKLLKERDQPTKNIKQNLEELSEKFDDLREELNETIEEYSA